MQGALARGGVVEEVLPVRAGLEALFLEAVAGRVAEGQR
jgi:hypothetical protein